MVILPLRRQPNPIPLKDPLEKREIPRDKGLQNVDRFAEARILAICKAKETDSTVTTALKLASNTYLVRMCDKHDDLVQISDDTDPRQ